MRYAAGSFQNDRGFALQRLSQPSEAAIGYLNLPRWLSQRFWVQRGVCGSIPASVQSKGKGVRLFPPLGSPAFPSGVGPLVSLLPAEAIRAVGVCVVDTGPAGSDRKFAIEAVQENAEALRYAADSFQNDRDFVKDAVRAKAEALHCAAERFQSSRSFVLEAIQANAEALRYVAGNFQSDKTFVIEAVKANVQALRCVTDGGFVLEAVKANAKALPYASEGFRSVLLSDGEFVLEAVKANVQALRCVTDSGFVLEAVKANA